MLLPRARARDYVLEGGDLIVTMTDLKSSGRHIRFGACRAEARTNGI
jgi:hypothetical protein